MTIERKEYNCNAVNNQKTDEWHVISLIDEDKKNAYDKGDDILI